MKLVVFNDVRLGTVKDDIVVDISDLVDDIPRGPAPGDRMSILIAGFSEYRRQIEHAIEQRSGVPMAAVTLRPPLSRPGNIDCMALNYMEDGERKSAPPINAFHKSWSSIIGPGETMVLPDAPARTFEGEAELAAVIGKRAQNVPRESAMEYVFGYTNFIDGSARAVLYTPDHAVGGAAFFFSAKSRDTFAPIGPFIVTADEILDPYALRVRSWISGKLVQDYSVSDMAHKIADCIAWLSSIHTLEPGDIVALGTNHHGLHPLQDGDRIEVETDGLGRLVVGVRDSLKRKWPRETRRERKARTGKDGSVPQQEGKYTLANV